MERTTETRRSGVRGEDEGKHEGDEKPGGLAGGPVEWRLAGVHREASPPHPTRSLGVPCRVLVLQLPLWVSP